VHYISKTMTCLILMMVVLTPMAGLLCDYLGRRKMLLFNAVFVACIVIPGFYALHLQSFILTIFVLIFFSLASSLEQGATSVAVVENFPLPARYTGLSLGYNLGNGFLGGTIPFIAEWLVVHTHIAISPAMYVSLCALITLLVVFFFVPETRGKSLT
jgi:MHS family proline/betaine transporter-like MFS transporter